MVWFDDIATGAVHRRAPAFLAAAFVEIGVRAILIITNDVSSVEPQLVTRRAIHERASAFLHCARVKVINGTGRVQAFVGWGIQSQHVSIWRKVVVAPPNWIAARVTIGVITSKTVAIKLGRLVLWNESAGAVKGVTLAI